MKKNFVFIYTILCLGCNSNPSYDLIIHNGWVYDGTMSAPKKTDIAVQNDRIVYIGDLKNTPAKKSIDATDLVVAPGFIDTHTHLDPLDNLMRLSNAESQLRQGVTTSIGGPDGRGVPLHYAMKPFLDSLENKGVGINMGFMTGHNKIREKVMGLENRAPTNDELNTMLKLVNESMDQGAFGLSTGLKYLPGNFAKLDEVIALSKEVAKKGGIYSTHLRDEGLTIMSAIEETIELSKKANILVVLTHHKVIGKPMWGKSNLTLARVQEALQNGVKIMLDQYPYNASHTGLSVLIPAWARAGGQQAFIDRIHNPVLREQIKKEIIFNILNDRGGEDLKRIQFARVKWKPELEGKTLHDWLVMEGLPTTIAMGAEMVIQGQVNGGASCIYHAMDEKDVENILKFPQTMIASDGRLSSPGIGHPHPRSYGTFPKILGTYVRDKKIISLTEAIYKMTGLPAKTFGIKDRGQLKIGKKADITVFDPTKIRDNATFIEPHQYPSGIDYVIVNGKIAIESGTFLNRLYGKVLRKQPISSANSSQ